MGRFEFKQFPRSNINKGRPEKRIARPPSGIGDLRGINAGPGIVASQIEAKPIALGRKGNHLVKCSVPYYIEMRYPQNLLFGAERLEGKNPQPPPSCRWLGRKDLREDFSIQQVHKTADNPLVGALAGWHRSSCPTVISGTGSTDTGTEPSKLMWYTCAERGIDTWPPFFFLSVSSPSRLDWTRLTLRIGTLRVKLLRSFSSRPIWTLMILTGVENGTGTG